VDKTVRNISDVPPHPTVSQFNLLFPTTHAEIIAKFTEHLRALPKTEGGKIVAIIDAIVSNPGVLLPWQQMVRICKEQGVWSVLDAAHSIGQEMNINLSQSQPDFWVSVRSRFVH
jgi:Cys-tRNA synthase (O-phospho-L-seryl-tRNA:Cys-tRNA synthase)